jgi:hypothetical protein
VAQNAIGWFLDQLKYQHRNQNGAADEEQRGAKRRTRGRAKHRSALIPPQQRNVEDVQSIAGLAEQDCHRTGKHPGGQPAAKSQANEQDSI